MISETLTDVTPTEKKGTRISFLLTPAVYLSTAFIILSALFSYCQPPIPAASAFSQFTGPPMVVCQIPALDMLHHSAGVSGVNCHFFFSLCFSWREEAKSTETHSEGKDMAKAVSQPWKSLGYIHVGRHVTLVLSVMLLQYASGQ